MTVYASLSDSDKAAVDAITLQTIISDSHRALELRPEALNDRDLAGLMIDDILNGRRVSIQVTPNITAIAEQLIEEGRASAANIPSENLQQELQAFREENNLRPNRITAVADQVVAMDGDQLPVQNMPAAAEMPQSQRRF